jgi:hypothetical protein
MQTIPENFQEDNWFRHDITKRPWPYADKQFDYVIVGHDLVTVRDPVAVCKEIQRVGKRGYIETPSVFVEHLKGAESSEYAGFSSHRWLADFANGSLRFVYKHPYIHTNPNFSIENPNISQRPYVNPHHATLGFFWENFFEVYEDVELADFPDWYFEENIWKYKELTKTEEGHKLFWSIDTPVPVLLQKAPFVNNSLVPISEVDTVFSVPLITNQNVRHPEMLKLEQILSQKLLEGRNV